MNVHEAKAHFSKLLARVAAGEEIVICKAGKPVARLCPIRDQIKPRPWRTAVGLLDIADDFNDPLPKDIEDSFYH